MFFRGKGKIYNTIEYAIGKGREGFIYEINVMQNYVLKFDVVNKRTETWHKNLLVMIASLMFDDAMQQS